MIIKNKNKLSVIVPAILFLGLIIGFLVGNSGYENRKSVVANPTPITRNNCLGDDCLRDNIKYPVAQLPEKVKDALNLAIQDEYKAYETYKSVIDKFGNVRPFIMIINAEQQHIIALQGIYEKYGIEIPQNNQKNNVKAISSVQEACTVGVDTEINNVNLYKNRLLPLVTEYPDITTVFTSLMNASEQKHLPAFQRCK